MTDDVEGSESIDVENKHFPPWPRTTNRDLSFDRKVSMAERICRVFLPHKIYSREVSLLYCRRAVARKFARWRNYQIALDTVWHLSSSRLESITRLLSSIRLQVNRQRKERNKQDNWMRIEEGGTQRGTMRRGKWETDGSPKRPVIGDA